jgi:hypothetical protein
MANKTFYPALQNYGWNRNLDPINSLEELVEALKYWNSTTKELVGKCSNDQLNHYWEYIKNKDIFHVNCFPNWHIANLKNYVSYNGAVFYFLDCGKMKPTFPYHVANKTSLYSKKYCIKVVKGSPSDGYGGIVVDNAHTKNKYDNVVGEASNYMDGDGWHVVMYTGIWNCNINWSGKKEQTVFVYANNRKHCRKRIAASFDMREDDFPEVRVSIHSGTIPDNATIIGHIK